MELLQLKYFATVADCESITLAARIHGVPQPSISQTISRLEKELGTELFDRVGKRIYLNEDGQAFLKQVNKSLDALQDGVQFMRDRRDEADQEMSLIVNAMRDQTLDCLYAYLKIYPKTTFTIHHHMQHNGKENPYDLCVSTSMPKNQFVDSHILCRNRISLVVPPWHELYGCNEPITAELLSKYDIVLNRAENDVGNKTRMFFQKSGVKPRIRVTCNEPHYIRSCVQHGLGIGVVANPCDDYWPKSMRFIPLGDASMERVVCLYWRTDRYMKKCAQQFREMLINHFENFNQADKPEKAPDNA